MNWLRADSNLQRLTLLQAETLKNRKEDAMQKALAEYLNPRPVKPPIGKIPQWLITQIKAREVIG